MQLPSAIQLALAVGCTVSVAGSRERVFREAVTLYDITGPQRMPMFVATIGHETGSWSRTSENLNYSAEGLLATWPSRFNADTARQYARQPQRIANRVYANRMGNGDEASGDGWRFRGHGDIQVTGKTNHQAVYELLLERISHVPDFGTGPGTLAEPRWAMLSAAAIWHDWGLNDLADADAFLAIQRRVNLGDKHSRGMPNGWPDRLARLKRARQALAA